MSKRDFKVEIGKIFKDEKRDLIIIDKERRKDKKGYDRKGYRYKCNKCGWDEGWISEVHLLRGRGCSCCVGKTVVPHINSFWAIKRDLCEKFKIKEDIAKQYTKSSSQKILLTCPNCGRQKEIRIDNLYHQGFSCICGDGISYPEKFMMGILDQLGVDYIFQLTKNAFKWCEKFRYDFYIPLLNMIIETHGRQHYEENGINNRSLKEEQENDRYKEELAIKNRINQYIIIDCRYSNKEYIKSSILNSKLNESFDLTKVDWEKCEEFALGSLIREVCNYWNNKEDWETTRDLMEVFKLSRTTIIDYLKRGAELGMCNYIPKEQMSINGVHNGRNTGKRVAMYDLNGNFIIEEYSAHELERKAKELGIEINYSKISAVARGERKHHKGYTFKYID